MQFLKFYLLILIILSISSACQFDDKSFKETKSVGDWKQDQLLTFSDISYEQGSVLTLRIFHSEDYGYENLYLRSDVISKTDTLLSKVMSIDFMDPFGNWKGKKSNHLRIVEHQLSDSFNTGHKSLTVLLQQHSRNENLSGIEKIELIVRPL